MLLGIVVLCLVVGPAKGQSDTTDAAADTMRSAAGGPAAVAVERVEQAFVEGDADVLMAEASDRVEVSLMGTRTFYSRSQAFYVLRDFFDQHEPRRFEVGDVTQSGVNTFITGRYLHARTEQPLRVYVRLQRATTGSPDGQDVPEWVLHEVRVEMVR